MDDGHQNPSLKKALSIVVVDGETREEEWPFGDGSVFPLGPMREPLAAGLARADAVVILMPADQPDVDPELLGLFTGKTVLIARLEPAAPPPAGPQVGFAGVGKPWKVERALEAAGCDLVDFVPLADHAALENSNLAPWPVAPASWARALSPPRRIGSSCPLPGGPRLSPGRCAPGSRTRRRWMAARRQSNGMTKMLCNAE